MAARLAVYHRFRDNTHCCSVISEGPDLLLDDLERRFVAY